MTFLIPLTVRSGVLPAVRPPLKMTETAGRRPLLDGQGRVIDHLRLSVTSACNLRCLYCRPAASKACLPGDLTDAQRIELVHFMADAYGLRQLRLTGGEPLLHGSIVRLIEGIRSSVPGLSIAMTTNGRRLGPMVHDLRAAGLDRLNVSLDSVDAETYRILTGGVLRPVIDGLERAVDAGFPPPRLNVVVLAGHNDHQLPDMVSWALRRQMEIRFLEAMPIGPAAEFNRTHFVPARRMFDILSSRFQMESIDRHPGETAARYSVSDGVLSGKIGIIAPLSESFCGQCRRVRVTADGRIFPCLLDDRSQDLRSAWRDGRFDTCEMNTLMESAVSGKQRSGPMRQSTAMVSLGG